MGEHLGADVPFCIVGGGARVSGIGECLEALPSMPHCPMVVACMGEGVSTPAAYGKLDEKYDFFATPMPLDARVERLCDALQAGDLSPALNDLFNRFEEVVPSEQPYVARLKEQMYANGAKKAMMSGSGPSVFGIFASREDAERAAAALSAMGAAAFVCHPTEKFAKM